MIENVFEGRCYVSLLLWVYIKSHKPAKKLILDHDFKQTMTLYWNELQQTKCKSPAALGKFIK